MELSKEQLAWLEQAKKLRGTDQWTDELEAIYQQAMKMQAGSGGLFSSDTASDVGSAVGSAAAYTAGKVVDFGTGTISDLITNIPSMIQNISEGDVAGLAWDLTSPVAGNLGEVVVEVAADGAGVAIKAGGKVIWEGSKAAAAKLTEADLSGLPGVSEVKETVSEATDEVLDQLTDADIDILEKIATGGLAALGEGTLGISNVVLRALGVDVDGLYKKYPNAAKTGATVGMVAGMVSVPTALARVARGVIKRLAGRTSNIARRGATKNLRKLKDEGLSAEDHKHVDTILADLDTMRANGYSNKEILQEYRRMVGSLPNSSKLRKIDDPFNTIVDKAMRHKLRTERTGGWVNDFKVDIKDHLKNVKLNLPGAVLDELAYAAGDFGTNFAYGIREAYNQGLKGSKAIEFAADFAFNKTPADVVLHVFETLSPGVLKLFPLAAETWWTTYKLNSLRQDAAAEQEEMPEQKNVGGLFGMHPRKVPMNPGGLFQPGKYNEGGLFSNPLTPSLMADTASPVINIPTDQRIGAEQDVRAAEAIPGQPEWVSDLVPILGDVKAAGELIEALSANPVNKTTVAALTAGLVVGLVPGVGDALAKPIKAAIMQAGKLVPSDIIGILRAVKEGDVEFLKGWGVPENALSAGARAAKSKSYRIRRPDGSIEEFTGTAAEFSEKYGVGKSAEKKGQGRIGDAQWVVGDKEFKDFKSGKTVAATPRMDPMKATFKEEGRARLPKLSSSQTSQLEDAVDGPLENAYVKWEDEWEDDLSFDGNFAPLENKQEATKIAESAWSGIVNELKSLDWVANLDDKQYNAVIQWAKNRSRRVFDVAEDVPKASKPIPGGGGAMTSGKTVVAPGVTRRRNIKEAGDKWDHRPGVHGRYEGLFGNEPPKSPEELARIRKEREDAFAKEEAASAKSAAKNKERAMKKEARVKQLMEQGMSREEAFEQATAEVRAKTKGLFSIARRPRKNNAGGLFSS